MLTRLNTCYTPKYRDDFFDNMVSGRYYGANYASAPAVNIIEGEKDYRIDLAAAGLSKNDFEIHIDKDILTISSKKPEEKAADDYTFARREFNYAGFSRSFRLDERIDQEGIKASHKDGVLSVILPLRKQEIKKGPMSIEIK